jgi:uncharacterized membrane protein
MNTHRNIKLLFLALIIVGICFIFVRSGYASADPFLDGKVKVLESKVLAWEHSAHVIAMLVFGVAVIGILVAALQPANKWWWTKLIVAVLSVLSACIIAYNQKFFPADDRTFEKAARQARALIDNFTVQLGRFQTLDQATRDSLYKSFQSLYAQIVSIENTVIYSSEGGGSGSFAPSGPGLIATAYAAGEEDKGVPAWVSTVPTDEKNFYFLGKAKAGSFDAAKQNAIADSRRVAAESFTKLANDSGALKKNPQLIEKLVSAMAAAGEVTQTFVSPNASSGTFDGYALLRISKGPARFAAESVFVRTSEAYDKGFLEQIQKE